MSLTRELPTTMALFGPFARGRRIKTYFAYVYLRFHSNTQHDGRIEYLTYKAPQVPYTYAEFAQVFG